MIWALLMGRISRMAGGGWPRLPHGLDQWLYAIPFGATVLWIAPLSYMQFMYAILAYATAFGGKRIGHGRGISLNEPMKPDDKPERVEHIILWLMPYVSTRLYKALILLLCEAIIWAGISIAVNPSLMLCSFIRPAAYIHGWFFFPDNRRGMATAMGEFLTGFISGVVLLYVAGFAL